MRPLLGGPFGGEKVRGNARVENEYVEIVLANASKDKKRWQLKIMLN